MNLATVALETGIEELPVQKFIASYEDNAKAEQAARNAGWTGEDGMLDWLNGDPPSTSRTFPTKALAEAWLIAEIAANKSLFGCGDIDVVKQIAPQARCRYCVCRGWKNTASFLVDDTGIVEEREVSDDCWNGED